VSCLVQGHFDREECEMCSTAYSEGDIVVLWFSSTPNPTLTEENDDPSGLSPSFPASPHTYTVSSVDAQGAAKPPTRSSSPIDDPESGYGPAVTPNNSLEIPHRLPSFVRFDPYYRRQTQLSTPTHIMAPDVLSPFSVGFSSLSISALTSHMRTRPVSDDSEEYTSQC
jgi:hypothetical protein